MTKKEKVKALILSGDVYLRVRKIRLAYRRKHRDSVSLSTIRVSLNELRDEGKVKRGQGGGRNARWELTNATPGTNSTVKRGRKCRRYSDDRTNA